MKQGYCFDFMGKRRSSDSPYIHWVWTGIALCDGTHVMAADGNLDFATIRQGSTTHFLLSGPTTKAQRITYKAGDEITGIRLRQGVHFAQLSSAQILDANNFLPNASRETFWLFNTTFRFPDFDTVEIFADKLARLGILKRDIVIENAIANRPQQLHQRTIQRHFIQTVGLTPYYVFQIKRAETAQELLKNGMPILQVVHETGFSDQSHMTNSLKYLIGYTPGKLRHLAQDW